MSAPYLPPPDSIPTLDVPSLEGIDRIHLVGIGGAGMSGIARLLLARGMRASGSDLKDSPALDALARMGGILYVGHDAAHIGDAQAVVASTAIPEDNPELAAARAGGVLVFARAQVLAALARGRRAIAVSGTHGKTTTTSMVAVILGAAGLDPTYVIGGDLNESGSGAHAGGGDLFVAEADESDGSFLLLSPEVGVITNIEEDHLDFYAGGRAEIEAAFARFAERSRHLVACGDDAGTLAALDLPGRADTITYGTGADNDAVLQVERGSADGSGGELTLEGRSVRIGVRVPGMHNLLNAAAAVLAAGLAGVPMAEAAAAVGEFTGVHRRFERRGEAGGATFVDDYAHHPTELAATLAAARRLGARRVVAVFQPHRYTRTQHLWRELGESLRDADLVAVTDVYGAGEQPIPGVSGRLLVDALEAASPRTRAVYLPHRSEIAAFLAQEVRAGDLVLTLGAGDVTMVPDEAIERIRERA